MADKKLTVYIGPEALEEILHFEENYPNLNTIITRHSEICVNLEDNEFEDIRTDLESDLVSLEKMGVKVVPLKEYFLHLKDNISDVIEKPFSVFYLDVDKEEAKSLSDKYGVIIQSEKDIDDNILQMHFYKRLEKGQRVNGQDDGWKNILCDVKLPPFNSLVVTDDFLLLKTEKNKNVGFENIKLLLNAILPHKLETVFHLLIITPMDKFSMKKANQFNGFLKSYLKSIRNYDFNLEFVFTDALHARKAYSSYFVLICDKGFKMFSPNYPTIAYEEINDMRLISILHDPNNSQGDTMLEMSIADLCVIKKLCKNLKEQVINKTPNLHKSIIGDTNKDKSVKNRLIN